MFSEGESALKRCILTFLSAAILLTNGIKEVHAGCWGQVAQCIYIDKSNKIQYFGLCAARTCGNVHDVFRFIRFPNNSAVRFDLFTDGKPVSGIDVYGISADGSDSKPIKGSGSMPEDLPWFAKTEEGETYLVFECSAEPKEPGDHGEACRVINSADFEILVKFL
jgi:hypothetical protein